MGEVFLAHDDVLERRVAIKRISTGTGAGEDHATAVNRLIREARSAAQIHHPHVVTVHDVVVEDGQTYVVMEYVPAPNLAQLVRRDGRLSPVRAANIGAQIAEALQAAHRLGIVHRDVKPPNILVSADDSAKLADFGVAQAAGDASLTRTGNLIGSVAFMAPEVARGGPATAATDVYSLGSTLYAVIEGRPPFAREGEPADSIAMLSRLISQPAPFARSAGLMSPIIATMLHSDPAMRPSAEAVKGQLTQLSGRSAGPAHAVSLSAQAGSAPTGNQTPPPFPSPNTAPYLPPEDPTQLRNTPTPLDLSAPPPRRKRSSTVAWLVGAGVGVAVIGLAIALILAFTPPAFWWQAKGQAECRGPLLKSAKTQASFGTTTFEVVGNLSVGRALELSIWTQPEGDRILVAQYDSATMVTTLEWLGADGTMVDPVQTPSTLKDGVYTLSVPSSLLHDKGSIDLMVYLQTGESMDGEYCTGAEIPIR